MSEMQISRTKFLLNFEKLPTKLYVPQPKICKNCWKYGHLSTKNHPCPNTKVCGNCSEDFHLKIESNRIIGQCERGSKCINCKRQHPAWSRECPEYAKEQQYWEIAVKQRITYNAAKQQEKNKIKSYATATASTSSTLTMTDNIQQQINRQQQDQHLSQQITNIMSQLKFLTDVVTKLCKINQIIIEETDTSDNEENMDADYDSEETVPATQLAPGRVPGLNQDELMRFKNNKRNKGQTTFKRAEMRREKRIDQKAGNINHPSKLPKRS